jgi:hypothetical protein
MLRHITPPDLLQAVVQDVCDSGYNVILRVIECLNFCRVLLVCILQALNEVVTTVGARKAADTRAGFNEGVLNKAAAAVGQCALC